MLLRFSDIIVMPVMMMMMMIWLNNEKEANQIVKSSFYREIHSGFGTTLFFLKNMSHHTQTYGIICIFDATHLIKIEIPNSNF